MRGKPALPSVPLTQQAFPFVDDDDRQKMGERYERERLKRIRRFIRNTDDTTPVVRVEVLNQPIFTPEGLTAIEVFTTDPMDAPDDSPGVSEEEQLVCDEQEKTEIINWFADRAEQFIGYVIDQAVEALASIGNAKEKAHILQWMFAADIHGYVIEEIEGQELTRPIFSRDVPMTFQWCCRVHGLSVERFQQSVLDALKFAEAEIRNREINGELKPGRHLVYRQARELVDNL